MEWPTKWREPSMRPAKGWIAGIDVLRQRLQRLAAARIVDVEGRKTGAFQRQLHLSKRQRRPADTVQQDDAIPGFPDMH